MDLCLVKQVLVPKYFGWPQNQSCERAIATLLLTLTHYLLTGSPPLDGVHPAQSSILAVRN